MIIPLASASDPRIAPYCSVRDRDLMREAGTFLVEGRVTLERLVNASRFAVESVLLAENRAASLAPVLAGLDRDVPVYIATQPVMDAIAGFPIHRGVLAMARRGPETPVSTILQTLGKGKGTLLALVGLSNHDNVGACFRNAAALDANAVIMDNQTCDPLYRKAIRVSAGAALTLPFARVQSGERLLDALAEASFECWALSPTGGEVLHTLAPPERLAIVLGPEGPGLPGQLIDRCRRVSIPMTPGFDSLNVATAGAIALAHVAAGRASRT